MQIAAIHRDVAGADWRPVVWRVNKDRGCAVTKPVAGVSARTSCRKLRSTGNFQPHEPPIICSFVKVESVGGVVHSDPGQMRRITGANPRPRGWQATVGRGLNVNPFTAWIGL